MEINKPVPKKIAIIGIGMSNFDYTLSVCKTGSRKSVADEVWAINKMGACIQCDMIWRMDDLKAEFDVNQRMVQTHNGDVRVGDLWEDFLKTVDVPIMTCKAYPEFPTSVEYPLENVVNFLNFSYFNTTPAYALAYAMYLGVEEVACYGLDYSYPNRHEAESGRACFEFILGIAHSLGVKIDVSRNSTLLDTADPIEKHFYGYGYPIEVKEDPDKEKRYKLYHRPDIAEKRKALQEKKERYTLETLTKKYTLLDAPLGAGQDNDSLKGDTTCQALQDTPKASLT
jgi:hypothetical protein